MKDEMDQPYPQEQAKSGLQEDKGAEVTQCVPKNWRKEPEEGYSKRKLKGNRGKSKVVRRTHRPGCRQGAPCRGSRRADLQPSLDPRDTDKQLDCAELKEHQLQTTDSSVFLWLSFTLPLSLPQPQTPSTLLLREVLKPGRATVLGLCQHPRQVLDPGTLQCSRTLPLKIHKSSKLITGTPKRT